MRDELDLEFPNLSLIICPGAKLHVTVLLVKRKEGDVDLAAAAETGRWTPEDGAVAADHRVTRHVARRVVISAGSDENIKYLRQSEESLHLLGDIVVGYVVLM